ncbi:Zn-dependent exopeptidase [Annulohypoxylon maeteangense]|uniref:Zn-dependent exopeptidase n=1 Tax=Annulohypoxylon maeteangense TaxID=1927788 RepID=UPI0020074ACC|nr:Zn-dependent exopeptidase [Annulohypoxylon maeteangense]KAI0890298.1 Zn-dependent exopeptidase [Annulohypoxylon maeteangense]
MKASLISLLLPAAASARFIEANEVNRILPYTDALLEKVEAPERFLIELSPGETAWVTEEEKWELRRGGLNFMDITENGDLGALRTASKWTPIFPEKVQLQSDIHPLLKSLSKDLLQEHLEKFSSFHTRYYKSDYGRQSSEWLLKTVQDTIKEAGADKYGVKAEHFKHSWGQNSIIATIPGQSNSTVVIGAHQDSINLWLPSVLPAPGADDDGSGTVTILEAFRVLLSSESVIKGNASNTIEFHWYSAEEGGLLGSQAIFSEYEKKGRDIKAMLQQDMTGYVQGTLDAGKPESVGVITDFVDPLLTAFIKKVIEEYCEIPWVETKCGYACSDHASASKAGYPSAFVIESTFGESDQHIHSTDDLIKYLSFDHMLQHARMTLALVYELGFTDFEGLTKDNEMGEL